MKTCRFLLTLLIALTACTHKQQVLPSNKTTTGNDTTKIPLTHHLFKGKYRLYDSIHHWWSNARGWVYVDTAFPLSRTIDVIQDSTDNYIAVGKDTFRYFDSHKGLGYPGYYSYFSSPVVNNQIRLSNDSVRFDKVNTGASHDGTDEISFGYRLP